MTATLWELQLKIREGAEAFGCDPGTPYTPAKKNYLEAYSNATRKSTQRDHALAHCCEMARLAHTQNHWHKAVDWTIAAFSLAETGEQTTELTNILQVLVQSRVPDKGEKSWGELL